MREDVFTVPVGTEMTMELLEEFIAKHKALVSTRYSKLQDAYENRYEIYSLEKRNDWKPDNRISVNFAKYIVDTFNGFFCGIPIKTTSEDETINAYLEFLDQYNDQDNGNAEVAKIADIQGKGHEMYYVDEDGEIGITYLSPLESFFIYDDSVLQRKLFFVRYYTDYDKVEHGSYSDSQIVRHFVNRAGYSWEGEDTTHGFNGVPAVEFLENEERMGIFESCMAAINAYNKAISEKANDVDYFADAYMKILGPKIEESDLEQIKRNRIINLEQDDEVSQIVVDFLQKPNADGTQENLINRLERLIFQISMVANISDENFGSSSGIALRYKLQAMSNLFKQKERKFASAIQERYRLIFGNPVSMSHGVKEDDWLRITTTFTPNYPANVSDETDVARNLEGIVSKKTQLSVLSIVDNVDNELQRIEEEQIDNQQVMEESLFGEVSNGQAEEKLLVSEGEG